MSVLFWFLSVLHSDGSWWVRCLTAVPEPEWPSVRLTSARSGMSARAPATWPTACERQPTYHQVTDCQVTIGSDLITAQAHDTKHTDSDGRISPPLQLQYCRHCLNISLEHFMDVQFAHSDWGTLGRFYWLEVHIWQIWSLLWHHDTFETWLLLVLFAISDVVICTVFSSVWLPCHSFDFLLIFKGKW